MNPIEEHRSFAGQVSRADLDAHAQSAAQRSAPPALLVAQPALVAMPHAGAASLSLPLARELSLPSPPALARAVPVETASLDDERVRGSAVLSDAPPCKLRALAAGAAELPAPEAKPMPSGILV